MGDSSFDVPPQLQTNSEKRNVFQYSMAGMKAQKNEKKETVGVKDKKNKCENLCQLKILRQP